MKLKLYEQDRKLKMYTGKAHENREIVHKGRKTKDQVVRYGKDAQKAYKIRENEYGKINTQSKMKLSK